jgi:site-specific recombinase XerD
LPKPECIKNLNGKPDEKVFKRWNKRPKFLERKLKQLGLTVWGWHNLRHRFSSKLSKEGKPIFEIMSLLGHSNIETTQIYLQLLG